MPESQKTRIQILRLVYWLTQLEKVQKNEYGIASRKQFIRALSTQTTKMVDGIWLSTCVGTL